MGKTLFVRKKPPTDYKTNKKENTIEITTPAAATTTINMKQTTKLNYKNIYLKSTKKMLFKSRWRTSRASPRTNKLNKSIPATETIATQSNSTSSIIGNINRMRHKMSFNFTKQHLWLMLWLLVVALAQHVETFDMKSGSGSTHKTKRPDDTSSTMFYSQLLSTTNDLLSMQDDANKLYDNDKFQPFMTRDPEQISRNSYTTTGQYRMFKPIDTNLRDATSSQYKSQQYGNNKTSKALNTTLSQAYGRQQRMARNQKSSMENVNQHEAITVHHKNPNNNVRQHQEQQQQQQQHHHHTEENNIKVNRELEVKRSKYQEEQKLENQQHIKVTDEISKQNDDLTSDIKSLNDLLVDYITNFFEKGQYKPMPGLIIELQNNHKPAAALPNKINDKTTRSVRQTGATDASVRIDLPRTLQTGRLLFLTGLKKVLWPVFMGLQVLKSLLIAMFIPAIIGSFTKLLGKGISTGSAPLFIRPMEPPQELDFRDNNFAFDEDNKFLIADDGIKENGPYAYNQQDAAQINHEYGYDPSLANSQLGYTRFGMNERQHQLMQDSYMNALQSIGSASFKTSGSLSSGSSGLLAPMAKRPPPAANVNTFQQFQNVPDSSLLLSNYDPFYSPLLSRLDSVFAQLKINSDKEMCREKLICLMYANPAKYAPYSNLVSAQLSRELNELRKPTSDNPDILRFFKYMRAAKDGQDGVDCEKTFDNCTEFKDFDNPAMVSTYHDINKLVQARKFSGK